MLSLVMGGVHASSCVEALHSPSDSTSATREWSTGGCKSTSVQYISAAVNNSAFDGIYFDCQCDSPSGVACADAAQFQ